MDRYIINIYTSGDPLYKIRISLNKLKKRFRQWKYQIHPSGSGIKYKSILDDSNAPKRAFFSWIRRGGTVMRTSKDNYEKTHLFNVNNTNQNTEIKFNGNENIEKIVNLYKSVKDSPKYTIRTSDAKLFYEKNKIKPNNVNNTSEIYKKNGVEYVTYNHLEKKYSAFETLTKGQKIYWSALLIAVAALLYIDTHFTLVMLVGILTYIYLSDFIFTLLVIYRSFSKRSDISFTNEELVEINDNSLPKYTILCPLYKEWEVIEQFTKAIEIIDWPKDKLEVLLLLEEDDVKTINKAYDLNLPSYFKIEVVPHSFPKTKPKACNYGLNKATGEYIVVYDAEDKPDPLQLKKAFLGFKRLSEEVVCLQSKLNYYNQDQNILTRLFTAEYSYWFNIALPGLQTFNTIIPLGGTSNHFKTSILKSLQGWDPFNVTEDCDLGTRLFKNGYKTSVIDSETLEEANSKIKGWIRQRSRWIKGYMQTYLVHMRNPLEFLLKYKMHAILFQLIVGMRMVFILINPVLWLMTLAYFTMYPIFGVFIESLYPWYIFYPAVFCLIFANFTYFYSYMIASAKKDKWELMQYIFLIPFYWLMTSISACIAFYQLAVKPYYWEKTKHGFHLQGQEEKAEDISVAVKTVAESSFTLFNIGRYKTIFTKFIHTLRAGMYINISISLPKSKAPMGFNIIGITSLTVNWKSFIKLFEKINISLPSKGKENILILNWRDTKHKWQGGAEVYVQEIAERWVKRGYGVTMFCSNDGENKYDENINGVHIIRRGGFLTLYIWAAIYYILRLRKHFDFIIDCENGIPFFTPIYSSKPKILLIHHVHQQIFRENLPLLFALFAMFLESKAMKYVYRYTKIVTVSESSKNEIVKLGLSDHQNIDIVNPGINLRSFARMKKYERPTFLYLGRLMPYKNVDILIKAFKEVLLQIGNARLIIAGTGLASDDLKALAARLGLENYVDFKGFVTDDERRRLLGKSWVMVQPSSFEGWGITVTEANASGTPVIASDTVGLRDSVIDGQTGLLVKTGSVKELSRIMIALTEMDGFRERISVNAYEFAKKYSWSGSSNNFLYIMMKLFAKKDVVDLPSYRYMES